LGFTLSPATPALAAVPDIPPSVLAQLKTMSPAEQAALARQYGFELPQNTGLGSASQGGSAVGNPGSEVTAFDRTQQLQLEAKVRAQIAEDEGREQGKELKRFGLDLFDQEVSTFAPVDDMPAPDGYRVGPGDTINVYLYGNEEVDVALAVSRDGQLILPRLGPISVTGLTFEEVRELIIAKVSAQLVGTEAVVSMGKLRSINVFLAGDVVAPGSYSVSGLSTVLQVLFSGGGVTDIGSLRQIQVKRRGKVVEELDAYDILLRGDTSGDIRLASGDTVFVPTVDRLVTIDGEVKRPAIYEVLPSETLGNLLEMAGGLNASGYAKSASIRRFETGRSSTTRIQFDLTDRKDLNALLFDGDYLNVDSIKEEVSNQVLLRGAVARPGGYEWFEGQRISDLIGSVEEDLLTETDLSTGLLVRRTGRGLEIETLAFDLGEIVASRGSAADFELRVKDEVLVFALPYLNESYQKLTEESVKSEKQKSVFEDRTDLVSEVVFRLEAQAKNPSSTQIVEIAGDVRLPGKYPLLENRNIDALIRLAGGFENSAYLTSAEVTRINFTSEGTARVASFKVPLVQTSEYQAFELKPLDQVRISRIPNWSYGDAVELTGSLVFPGSYPIVPGEKLSSLVSRAGGIAENGFPQGAVLIKVEAKEREQAQLEKLIASIQRTALAQSQTREQESNLGGSSAQADLELLEDLLQSDAGGRVVIDLPAILAGDPSADIQLEAGDSLFVPEFNSTISVIGEVRQPGTFRFDTDRRVNDYIEQAAGATVRADLKVAYVVRANGKVDLVGNKSPLLSFRSSRASDLQPGDTIVVPVNEEYQPVLARYKEVSTVIFQSVASLYPLFRL
jgi:polysaccharide export outer membrane protein